MSRWNWAWGLRLGSSDLSGLQLDEYLEGDPSLTYEDMRGTHTEAGLEMLGRLPVMVPRHSGKSRVVKKMKSRSGWRVRK